VLLLTPHVLAMDPASWRIVLGELEAGWHALASGRSPAPVREHTSLRTWSELLGRRAQQLDTVDFWLRQLAGDDPALGARRIRPETDRVGDVVVTMAFADPDVTARVLAGPVPVTETLAAATARAISSWRRHRGQSTPPPLVALETHGRADTVVSTGLGDDAHQVDTGDTIGLFSSIYPLRLTAGDAAGVADEFAAVPGDGIDYGLLRYLRADTADLLAAHREPQVLLNYLGRFQRSSDGDVLQPDRSLLAGVSRLPEPNQAVRHEITLNVAVVERHGTAVFGAQWRTLPDILSADDVATLQATWSDALREVIQ
jgi:mycobactin peptide synthetase MbtF